MTYIAVAKCVHFASAFTTSVGHAGWVPLSSRPTPTGSAAPPPPSCFCSPYYSLLLLFYYLVVVFSVAVARA